MWKGLFNGIKGYKTWRFKTSVPLRGANLGARYYKEGVFSVLYRRKGDSVDKKTVADGIKSLLDFKGKSLTVTEYAAGIATIEFYCRLDNIPSEEVMQNIESFLHTADISS